MFLIMSQYIYIIHITLSVLILADFIKIRQNKFPPKLKK